MSDRLSAQILSSFALKTEVMSKGSFEEDIGLPKYEVTTITHYHAPSMVSRRHDKYISAFGDSHPSGRTHAHTYIRAYVHGMHIRRLSRSEVTNQPCKDGWGVKIRFFLGG